MSSSGREADEFGLWGKVIVNATFFGMSGLQFLKSGVINFIGTTFIYNTHRSRLNPNLSNLGKAVFRPSKAEIIMIISLK